MADTIKDYLVGIGFQVDEAGAGAAEGALNGIDSAVKSLGEILVTAGEQIRTVFASIADGVPALSETASGMDGAAASADGLAASELGAAESLSRTAQSAGEAAEGLGKADQKAAMESAKKGASNVSSLDDKLKKASASVKKFAAAAVTMLGLSSLKTAITDAITFTLELSDSAKELGKTTEEARAYDLALSAMGKTADEIAKSDSLTQTFNDLQAIGTQMALPEGAEGLTMISELKDGFLSLKLTANYALQWLIYKMQTVAEGPLSEVRDMLTGIREWFSGHIEEIAAAIAKVIGGVIQVITSAITAVKSIIDWIDRLPPSIKTAGAIALAVIAAIHSKTFLITAILSAILLLVDDFVTYMQGGDSLFGDFWGKCIEWVNKVKPYIETFIHYFSAGLDAIGAAVKWVCDLLGEDTVLAIGLVGAALWALSANPIVLIIAAVVSLIAGLGWLVENWDLVKAKAEEVWGAVKDWCVGAWDKIKEVWGNVVAFFQGIWDGITGVFSSIGEWFSGIFQGAKDAVTGVWDGIVSFFSGIWSSIQSDPVLSAIATVLSAPYKLAWEGIKAVWDAVAGFFSAVWSAITGDGGLSGILDALKAPFVNAWEAIKGVWDKVTGFFSGIFGGISGDSSLSGVTEAISSPFSAAWDAVSGIFSGIGSTFSEWFSGIDISSQVAAVSDWASGAWDTITNTFSGVTDWFSTTFSGVGTTIQSAIGDVASFASSTWESVKGAASDVGGWFAGLFGWGSEDDTAASEMEANAESAGSAEKQALIAAFEGADSDVAAIFANMVTLSDASFELLTLSAQSAYSAMGESTASLGDALGGVADKAKTMASDAVTAMKGMPSSAKSIFSSLSSSMTSTFSKAASNVKTQINAIKTAIKSIPTSVKVNVSANKAFSMGGKVEHETQATIGEDGTEYVIPVTKPSRAMYLLKQAADDLGLNIESAKKATTLLGGSATSNVTPSYASSGTTNVSSVSNSNNRTVSAPATINVYGTDAKQTANLVKRNQEQLLLRNIKSALA